MNDSENILEKIKNNKKSIKENAHVVTIILLVAFIVVDAIIILYLFNENDKYHIIFQDVSKLEATQIKQYLVDTGIQATLNEKGQVVVAKEHVEIATLEVEKKFFPTNQLSNQEVVSDTHNETEEDEDVVDFESIAIVSDLEQQVKSSLEKHVSIKNANVRIEDYGSPNFDVSVIVVITIEMGTQLQNADLDNIGWLITSLVNNCDLENITIINSETNAPFQEEVKDIN